MSGVAETGPPTRFRRKTNEALNVMTNAILEEARAMVEEGDTSGPTRLNVVWDHTDAARVKIFTLADEYAAKRIEEERKQMEIGGV
jgi:hypothetical protein